VDLDVLMMAGGIFLLRVIGNMVTTLRTVMLVRGQKIQSSLLAILESLIFAIALGSVVSNLHNLANLSAYVLGYAVGGYLGLVVEGRLVQKFVAVQAVSPHHAHDIAQAIRDAGYGATESWGMGGGGQVGSVTAVVGHHQVKQVIKIVQTVDPAAFVMMEELRGISQGYFRRLLRQER
jgi:uncharacterized protein YebE (UPF0316 family)